MNPKFKLPYQVLVSVSCSFFYFDPFSPAINKMFMMVSALRMISCRFMKSFTLKSRWLTRWPFIILVLNKGGGQLKNHLYVDILTQPCNSNGQCMMCGGTILNKVHKTPNYIVVSKDLLSAKKCQFPQRYVVTAAHCLFDGNTQLTVKGGAKFRVMVGEHDHCKHNEVRRSSKSKTNKHYQTKNN